MHYSAPAFVALTLLVGGASVAVAQSANTPGPSSIFGGARPDSNAKKRLDLTASLVQGYDSDVPESLQTTLDPSSLQSGGNTTALDASLSYSWSGTGTQVGFNAASNIRHYSELGATKSLGHSAGVGLSATLPSRFTLFVNQAAAYTPTYMYGIFPSAQISEPGEDYSTLPDYAVGNLDSYVHTTDVGLARNLTQRNSLSLSTQFQYVDRLAETEVLRDEESYRLQVQFSRRVSQNTTFTIGPRYWSSTFGYTVGGTTTEVGVDFAVDHTQPLSASRQVKYRLRLSPIRMDIPNTPSLAFAELQKQYRLVVEFGVDYPLTRMWQLQGNYRQGMEYVPDLPQPVFANGVSVSASGFVSRRVDLSFSGGYSSGASLISRESLLFDTYAANVRTRIGLSRTLATYVEGLYYFYDFHNTQPLPPGLPRGLERVGARAGLTFWLPALRK
jgi:hypothetical protein